MHGSDSQSRLINEYIQEEICDPLQFVEVKYERSEWDNIPTIIPRYCIHLAKHLEGLINHYNLKCKEESTKELREAMEAEINKLGEMLNLEEDDRKIKEQDHLGEIDGLRKMIGDLKQGEVDRHQKAKQMSEESLLENFVPDQSDRLSVSYETVDYKKSQRLQQDLAKVSEPRAFSMKQVRELIFAVLHTSQFRSDFLFHLEAYEDYKVGQYKTNESLWEQINYQQVQIEELQKQQTADKEEYSEFVFKYERQLTKDHRAVEDLENVKGKILKELDNVKGFQEVLEGRLDKTNYKINQAHDKLDLKIDGVKAKVEIQIKDQEKRLLELREAMSTSLDAAKASLSLQIEQLSERQFEHVKQEISRYEEKIKQSKEETKAEMEVIVQKNKKKITKIKEVCTTLFKNHDEAIKQLKAKFTTVHDAFEIWNNNFYKPQDLKEATLYALDCQLKEIEKTLYMDMDNVKDILNKLIYSLEQHSDIAKGQVKSKARLLDHTLNREQLEDCLHVQTKHLSRKELGSSQLLSKFGKDQLIDEQKSNIFNNQTINKRATFFTSAMSQQPSPTHALNQTTSEFEIKKPHREDSAIKLKGQELLFTKRLRFLRQKISAQPRSSVLLKKVVQTPQNLPLLQTQGLHTSQEFHLRKEADDSSSGGQRAVMIEIGMECADLHSAKQRGSTKERQRTERAQSEFKE